MNKKELKEAIKYTINCSRMLLAPHKPRIKGLDPTFYHTLTYDGDVKLINDYNEMEKILLKFLND